MKNVNELIEELSAVFMNLKTEKLAPKVAKEMNNSAGKIISASKAQLEYYSLRKEKPTINFLSASK